MKLAPVDLGRVQIDGRRGNAIGAFASQHAEGERPDAVNRLPLAVKTAPHDAAIHGGIDPRIGRGVGDRSDAVHVLQRVVLVPSSVLTDEQMVDHGMVGQAAQPLLELVGREP